MSYESRHVHKETSWLSFLMIFVFFGILSLAIRYAYHTVLAHVDPAEAARLGPFWWQ